MKLILGDKIRNLRKTANMTQEQLADRLGMSCQAVSRWENGTAYPDLELLPPLAEIFGMSSDFLLGIPEEKKEQEAKKLFTELVEATYAKEVDTEKVIRLIREIRLNHLKSRHFHNFWLSAKGSVYRLPEILPEIRITAETILDGDYPRWNKEEAIRHFSCLECGEKIEDFLNRYASGENMTRKHLLYNRYLRQRWTQKRNLLRQDFLMKHIDQLIGLTSLWQLRDPAEECPEEDYEILRLQNDLCLDLLHRRCCQVPEENHPVSGNGKPDLWVEPRLNMGIEKTFFLSQAGEYDKALLVLEDVVSLLEKAMAVASPIKLGCSSPWLKDIIWTAEEDWGRPDNYIPNAEEERMLLIHDEEWTCYCIYPSTYYQMLTYRECTDCYTRHAKYLDPIRDDIRFRNLTERIRALIVTKNQQE